MNSQMRSDGQGFWDEQDINAFRNYALDWVDDIPEGMTIASSVWESDDALTLSTPGLSGSVTSVWVQGGELNVWYAITNTITRSDGLRDQYTIRLFIRDDSSVVIDGSALFPNRGDAVAQMRRDNLMIAAQNHFPGVKLGTDYLWGKLIAAEAEASRTLKVKFEPTTYFPLTPTQAQIDALNGMPWEEDPAYDYDPDMFQGEMWGFIAANNRPIISVTSLKYIFPSPTNVSFEVPAAWLRLDKKYGQVRIVPSTVTSVPVSAFMMQLMGGARVIPHMLQLTYVAGLANAARDYPDLVDVVKKMAVLKIIADGFLPQSGSISADGLSQSMSLDMSKYEDSIDHTLNGAKGSNGGLMTAIHGIRLGVM